MTAGVWILGEAFSVANASWYKTLYDLNNGFTGEGAEDFDPFFTIPRITYHWRPNA